MSHSALFFLTLNGSHRGWTKMCEFKKPFSSISCVFQTPVNFFLLFAPLRKHKRALLHSYIRNFEQRDTSVTIQFFLLWHIQLKSFYFTTKTICSMAYFLDG